MIALMSGYAQCVYLETRGGYRNWNYRGLGVTLGVLGNKPRSPVRAVSAPAQSCKNTVGLCFVPCIFI